MYHIKQNNNVTKFLILFEKIIFLFKTCKNMVNYAKYARKYQRMVKHWLIKKKIEPDIR